MSAKGQKRTAKELPNWTGIKLTPPITGTRTTEFRDGMHGLIVWALATLFAGLIVLATVQAASRLGHFVTRITPSIGLLPTTVRAEPAPPSRGLCFDIPMAMRVAAKC
jgi:hypothetical protein